MSKNFDVVLENHDVTIIFLSYGQSEAIWKPDSRPMACVKLMFLLIATFYLTKTENRTKKSHIIMP